MDAQQPIQIHNNTNTKANTQVYKYIYIYTQHGVQCAVNWQWMRGIDSICLVYVSIFVFVVVVVFAYTEQVAE